MPPADEQMVKVLVPVTLLLGVMSAYQIARLLTASRAIRRLQVASPLAHYGHINDSIRVLPFILASLPTSLFLGAGCGLVVLGMTRCSSYIGSASWMTWTEWLYMSLMLTWPLLFYASVMQRSRFCRHLQAGLTARSRFLGLSTADAFALYLRSSSEDRRTYHGLTGPEGQTGEITHQASLSFLMRQSQPAKWKSDTLMS
jgi:hypothetical protein